MNTKELTKAYIMLLLAAFALLALTVQLWRQVAVLTRQVHTLEREIQHLRREHHDWLEYGAPLLDDPFYTPGRAARQEA